MTRAVVSAPSKLPRLTIVFLRIAVQPARKKKITSKAKNSWIIRCGAEAVSRPITELGVSILTALVRSWLMAICDSVRSMKRSRFL
jgi:hypothetical protein